MFCEIWMFLHAEWFFCFTSQILKYVFQSRLCWNFVNVLRIYFTALIILLHFLFQYNLNSLCDCFHETVFFIILHNQFYNDFAYVSVFSTLMKRENMKIFHTIFLISSHQIFFTHVCRMAVGSEWNHFFRFRSEVRRITDRNLKICFRFVKFKYMKRKSDEIPIA